MADNKKPGHAQDTGHEWDGIRELTNPPPRWWLISFHASWIWCVVYFILYPAIPMVHDASKGILGWTQIQELKEAVAENDAIKGPYLQKVAAMSGDELLADAGMRNFSEQAAKALYGDNCAGCHGAGGEGATGLFPVLADDDWLYGGSMDNIIESITEGHQGNMPAHEGSIDEADINALADFVISLPEGKATPEGFAKFDEVGCTGCHGADAKGSVFNGDSYAGAVNLTDQIWRFGGSREDVLRTIRFGVNQEDVANTRVAIMPAFGKKLSAEDIKMLAVKVHGFGGGQ